MATTLQKEGGAVPVHIRGPRDEAQRMKALAWWGKKDVRVVEVGKPLIADPVSEA
jgi:hypothetical protein